MNEAMLPIRNPESARSAEWTTDDAKIMIVDDDPTTIDLVEFHLSEMGYSNFVSCIDAQAALQLVIKEVPDVLLLDLVMPQASGLEILQGVRMSFEPARLPVIILTAVDHVATKIEAFELGATDFLNKPVNFVELAPRIRNALLVKTYHDQLKQHADELQHQVALKTASLKESHASLEKANAVLRRSCEAAEKAAKAKSEFLANVSHELRTPLTAVIGFTEELLSELDATALPPRFAELLPIILRNGTHLLEIVNDILDVARIEKGQLAVQRVTCSPDKILNETVEALRPEAEIKGLELIVNVVPPIPETIQSDPVRLRQILFNLIKNAIKFTEKGRVRVETRLLGANGPAPVLQFEVSDTGIGIAPEQLNDIFKPFKQAMAENAGKYEGVGLGLTICQYLAEELGGHIQAKSELGKGSTFQVTVATGSLEQGKSSEKDDIASGGPGSFCRVDAGSIQERLQGKRILLAEDAPDNQRLIRFILEKAGAIVTIVGDGRAGVETALEAWKKGEAFDTILTDIQMPHVDGYELTKQLRAAQYTAPIVALTANAMAGERQKCLAAGCDDYLSKPIDRAQLLSLVARYTNGPPTSPPPKTE
ncbi:MAG: response regulator [Pirellulales bacterium]|nr:response regulator [Pirellulales bacterium]